MSTFGALNTAYSGLTAARLGLEVTGQNLTNVNTDGYTRQRVSQSGVGAVTAGRFSTGVRPGQGVVVDGIARLSDARLDARVRSSTAVAAFAGARAAATGMLEDALHEPGPNGITAALGSFWSAWGNLSNHAGEQSADGILLQQAAQLTAAIGAGSRAVADQWSQLRGTVDAAAAELNTAAAQVADLNGRIRSTLATGGSANELLDQRGQVLTRIAELAGGSVRELADGTVTVYLGGNAIVTGDTHRAVVATGGRTIAASAADPVRLEWAHAPGVAVELDGGSIGGAVSMLAGTEPGGTGGALAEAAASYDALAVALHDQVNAVHSAGVTASGNPGGKFFSLAGGLPPAQALGVVPVSGGIATGAPGAGGADGSTADAIAALGRATGSPDALWATFVTRLGVSAQGDQRASALADLAASSARSAQQSVTLVDIDEENVNLLAYQRAYQGAARMMTAIDEALDVLINRTGLVGR